MKVLETAQGEGRLAQAREGVMVECCIVARPCTPMWFRIPDESSQIFARASKDSCSFNKKLATPYLVSVQRGGCRYLEGFYKKLTKAATTNYKLLDSKTLLKCCSPLPSPHSEGGARSPEASPVLSATGRAHRFAFLTP